MYPFLTNTKFNWPFIFVDELTVLFITKRKTIWEPIFIGTNEDPPYDERLTWEGKGDKMTQAFLFCLLNYNFAILDNAYIIHKPGIKSKKAFLKHLNVNKVGNQTKLLKKIILPELKLLYGNKNGCTATWLWTVYIVINSYIPTYL